MVAARTRRRHGQIACTVNPCGTPQDGKPATAPPPQTTCARKNRRRWQVLTVWGRRTGQDARPRKGNTADQSCDLAKQNTFRAAAHATTRTTTSNRQNLPATAVFRAQAGLRGSKTRAESPRSQEERARSDRSPTVGAPRKRGPTQCRTPSKVEARTACSAYFWG